MLVVWHHIDDDSPLASLEPSERIGLIFGTPDEHLITGYERHGTERAPPRVSGADGEGDFVRPAVEVRGRGIVEVLEVRGSLGRDLVAARQLFGSEIVDHRIDHLDGRQRGPAVVEVHNLLAAAGVGAEPFDVEHSAQSSWGPLWTQAVYVDAGVVVEPSTSPSAWS